MFALNVTANYRLIRSIDLLLRQADAGPRGVRLVVRRRTRRGPSGALYAASKAALEALVKATPTKSPISRVKANVFWPGRRAHRDARQGHAGRRSRDAAASAASVAPKLIDMISPAFTESGQIFDVATDTLKPL